MWTDGILTFSVTSASPTWYDSLYEVAGRTWNLRVNQQIGGTWGGLPDSTTDWANTTMTVDYIKTWVPAA
jgi:hypothetical protein